MIDDLSGSSPNPVHQSCPSGAFDDSFPMSDDIELGSLESTTRDISLSTSSSVSSPSFANTTTIIPPFGNSMEILQLYTSLSRSELYRYSQHVLKRDRITQVRLYVAHIYVDTKALCGIPIFEFASRSTLRCFVSFASV